MRSRASPQQHPWPLRLLAGAMGGAAGGLVFGVLMAVPAVRGDPFFGRTGMLTLVAEVLGLTPEGPYLAVVWAIHFAVAIALGVLFAAIVPLTLGRGTTLALGVAYGVVVWLLAAFLLLRTLTGAPLALDAAALANLVGHALFGAALGWVYPRFAREEERMREGTGGFKPVRPA